MNDPSPKPELSFRQIREIMRAETGAEEKQQADEPEQVEFAFVVPPLAASSAPGPLSLTLPTKQTRTEGRTAAQRGGILSR